MIQVGQTGPKTQKVIEQAKQGVLFIDEAYRLSQDNGKSDFGREAIEQLMGAMNDPPGKASDRTSAALFLKTSIPPYELSYEAPSRRHPSWSLPDMQTTWTCSCRPTQACTGASGTLLILAITLPESYQRF